ncbi:hypothetical protein F9883_09425 [Morganella morganii]|uniref:hypothetical protein n=1 Tax=Morganella morganii TaxID=582 RepID=UPI0015F3619A|nr:hypothetical protein [Morganella morganii]MBA5808096.1 hypothetical protein [Morganella morganii]
MASRLDIEKSRLIYTQEIGWIDRNHASGGDARNLWAQLLTENTTPYYKDYFLVSYDQFMGKFFIKMGVTSCWLVKKGLREEDKKSIALSMMFYISTLFETHQRRFLFSGLSGSDSGFSGEDLISNLLGFYSVIEPRDYWSLIKPLPLKLHCISGIIMALSVNIKTENCAPGFSRIHRNPPTRYLSKKTCLII